MSIEVKVFNKNKADRVKVKFHSQDKDNMRFRDIKTDKIYNMESRQVPGLQLMDGPFWTDKIYDAILINENTIQHPF